MNPLFKRLIRYNPKMGIYVGEAQDFHTFNVKIKTTKGNIIIPWQDAMNYKIDEERIKQIAATFIPD